jgi:magnesium-transporting ATPase (P-type)
MFWPIFIYVVMTIAISVSAGMNAGFWVALHAAGGSVLALSAGGGLRASLRGGRAQKIWGTVIAVAILALALWVSLGFSARLFEVSITGPVWAIMGFVVCLVFADKKLTGP